MIKRNVRKVQLVVLFYTYIDLIRSTNSIGKFDLYFVLRLVLDSRTPFDVQIVHRFSISYSSEETRRSNRDDRFRNFISPGSMHAPLLYVRCARARASARVCARRSMHRTLHAYIRWVKKMWPVRSVKKFRCVYKSKRSRFLAARDFSFRLFG